jgi:tetratricopeptide (TPR) repeat protein
VPFTQFSRTLEAAVGYFELGMATEALSELDTLPPSDQSEEDVLELRQVLNQHLGRWSAAAEASEGLCRIKGADADRFISWACCLYELGNIEACRSALLQAPLSALDHGLWNFHLACYEALLGHREEAQRLIQRGIRIEPLLRSMAERNSNLAPLVGPATA